jgi:hypothetical protein
MARVRWTADAEEVSVGSDVLYAAVNTLNSGDALYALRV